MKTTLLITGVALLVIGSQDVIRILVDNSNPSIFGWLPGGMSAHVAAGILVAIAGVLLAGFASKKHSTK